MATTARLTAIGSVTALVATTGVGMMTGRWKLTGIAWVAFLGMAGGGWLGIYAPRKHAGALVWGYGLASGAMITSAALFLLPQALDLGAAYGGIGVAVGLLVGYAAHTLGHRLSHVELPIDRSLAELTAHAVSAGAIIGVVYGNMPELGPLLGLAIVSHKGPAGYAAVSRFAGRGGEWIIVLLPAAAVGVVAVVASFLVLPPSPAIQGIVFGFATGVFLHVAMDFLPRCELGSEVHEALAVEGEAHALLDRLRVHAVASTLFGGFGVVLGWLLVA